LLPKKLHWQNTVLLEGDAAEAVKELKAGEGPELQIYGSGNFVQTLLKNDLVDELWLKFYPLTLGTGKRLFAEGTIPAAFTLTKSAVTPDGVIFANYARAGEVKTGSMI
jgi:dihydrofolate reductase